MRRVHEHIHRESFGRSFARVSEARLLAEELDFHLCGPLTRVHPSYDVDDSSGRTGVRRRESGSAAGAVSVHEGS
jgi:hypothetical protein